MIRIFIVDDHGMMREGLKKIIASTHGMEVVGEAVDGQAALDTIVDVDCDVLVMDITMPRVSGLDLIKAIKQSEPFLPILVLSMHNVGKIAAAALKAGASGYLTKDSDPDHLLEAIHEVAHGGRYIDPTMVNKIVFEGGGDESAPHEYLSKREQQIFHMIVAGKSTNEIAVSLYLSAKTVSTHKKRIMEKMKIYNTADLVRYAVEHQLSE